MTSREKRLRLVELALPQDRKQGMTWEEFQVIHYLIQNFPKIWPVPTAAPLFLQEEHRQALERFRQYDLSRENS